MYQTPAKVSPRPPHHFHSLRAIGSLLPQFYTCGSRKIAQGIREVLTRIIKEGRGVDDAAADELFQRAIRDRYATDIFE